jgi:glutamine amidotransferase
LGQAVIAVLDYGAGNLTSVLKGLRAAGADVVVVQDASSLAAANAIVVPGVGHFGATGGIDVAARNAIRDALGRGRPLLGICLGMQYLFEGSTEAPDARGLGLFPGHCGLLPPTEKVPHVGWNDLRFVRSSRLLENVPDGSLVYFTHSYAAPITDVCVAATDYSTRFAAAVERGNVFGVQFHPEKSGEAGMRILRNFVALC